MATGRHEIILWINLTIPEVSTIKGLALEFLLTNRISSLSYKLRQSPASNLDTWQKDLSMEPELGKGSHKRVRTVRE